MQAEKQGGINAFRELSEFLFRADKLSWDGLVVICICVYLEVRFEDDELELCEKEQFVWQNVLSMEKKNSLD